MQDVRTRLIEATFQEVFSKGFSGASLAIILKSADVKKGAMYHYFPSKKDMVLAMIDEKIEKRIENKWEVLTNTNEDILDSLISILQDINSWDLTNGCPLGNLLQESLDQDEDFAKSLTSILDNWKILFTNILQKAKERNQLKEELNISQCATFLIASIEGALLLSKKCNDKKDFEACMNQLTLYLNSLRKNQR